MSEMSPELAEHALDEIYTLAGFLSDTNGDGYPDDLRARIVLEGDISPELWCALLDLAARLGLETAGLSLPLVVDRPAPDQLPTVVRDGGADEPEYRADGWQGRAAIIAAGSEAVRRLVRLGLGQPGEGQPRPTAPNSLDLARLFEDDGLLADADSDGAPDGTRLCVVVPDEMPRAVGAALIDFVARLGLESGGVDLPIATTDAGAVPPRTITLRVSIAPGLPATLTASSDGPQPSLQLSGDPEGMARLLTDLARRWPDVPGSREAGEIVAWLRRTLAGWTPEGRAAALRAELEAVPEVPQGGHVRLLVDDPTERARLAAIVRDRLGSEMPLLGPETSQVVFHHNWSAQWEFDRAIETLQSRVLPSLTPGQPVELTIVVSEPPAVRHRLERAARQALEDRGIPLETSTVRVFDAFKTGLCWIREEVLPRWQRLSGIESVVIRFLPLTPPAELNALDMRIRWLQELYPADELIARALGIPRERITLKEWQGEATYALEAYDAGGRQLAHEELSPPWYRRPYIGPYPDAGTVHVSTGGVLARQGEQEVAARCPTDLDRFWDYFQEEVLPAVGGYIVEQSDGNPHAADQPFFDELRVEVGISEVDVPYGIREEWNSAAEALHEDIYFNALDYIEELGKHLGGERLSAPGSVVPIVHVRPGLAPHASVTLRGRAHSVARLELGSLHRPIGTIARTLPGAATFAALRLLDSTIQPVIALEQADARTSARLAALAEICPPTGDRPSIEVQAGGDVVTLAAPAPDLLPEVEPADASTPDGMILTEANLLPLLSRVAGRPEVSASLGGRSYQGRPIPAVELTAPMTAEVWSARKLSRFKPTFLIVGRHHANEVASTTAALKLIEWLTEDEAGRRLLGQVSVALIPYENADGAALHEFLQREHPTWKHHPARYNAVGFEFGEHLHDPDTPYGEARVRGALWRRWLPDVVVDNHGVPSHEWAQIFAGFGSPPRFRVSYWQLQALIYGILHYLDDPQLPEHRDSAFALREAVARDIGADTELLEWNRVTYDRYHSWGSRWEPERFPEGLHREMMFHFGPVAGSGFGRRAFTALAPKLTVISWVTEVGDETAHGDHLERTSRAHLIANLATLDLLAAAAGPIERQSLEVDGSTRITVGRRRPITLGG